MTDLSKLSDAELQQILGQSAASATPQPQAIRQAAAQVPTYSTGFDPTKATDQQLQAFLADTDPRMSTGEDMARSGVGGAQRGVTGMATSYRGISDLAHGAAQAGADFLARHGIGDGKLQLPQVGDLLHAPGVPGLGDALQIATRAGATALHVKPELAQMALDVASPTAALSQYGPSGEQGAVAINGGIPIHVPQTTAGRYTQRVAEFSPLLTTPGSAASRLANVIVPGLVSQGAEDLAPDKWKTAAALAGAVAGGGVVAAGQHIMRAPDASFGRAMGDITPEQIDQAQQLRTQAAQRGIDLTLPEAVQQVTNNGTGLGRLQRVIESTREGQKITAPYFADRPNQIAQAVRDYADTIAPASEQPGMVGVRAQDAASSALDQARQVVNRAAAPDYAALTAQTLDPAQYEALSSDPSYRRALAQLRGHPELGARVADLPDNSLAVVNEVKKRLAVAADQAAGTPLAPGDNHLAALRINAKALADEIARQASPEYAAANDTVRQLSGQYVDPLRAGPLGAISKTAAIKAQTAALYPSIPAEGAPSETAQAVRVLTNTSPGVSEDLTRQHLVNALNESLSENQGGQNQYSGAKYAVRIAANPEQAATLRAGVSALPGGDVKASDLDALVEALKATGKRQPPGSMTAFNTEDLKAYGITPGVKALKSFNIAKPLEPISAALEGINYRRNVERLAQMIMADPQGTKATLEAAQAAASKASGTALLPAVLRARENAKR